MTKYKVGDWILIHPNTVALGFKPRGVIDRVSPYATMQYRVLFSDGSFRRLHENQILGIEYSVGISKWTWRFEIISRDGCITPFKKEFSSAKDAAVAMGELIELYLENDVLVAGKVFLVDNLGVVS